MPELDVLLPVRQAERTLDAALSSLVRQSFRDWRCVLVAARDSTDGTVEVAERWAGRESRIQVFAHDDPPDIVSALLRGLQRCDAPFTARMDADDVAHRHRFRDQLALLSAEPQLCGAGCHVRTSGPTTEGRLDYERWLNRIRSPADVARERFVECPLAHPTLCIRTDVLATFGYRRVDWPEDYDLVLRLAAAGQALGVVPRRRLLWRDRPERLSRTGPAYAQSRFTACKAAFLADGILRDEETYVLWGYGRTGRTVQEALRAQGKRPRRIVEVHPGRIGNTIAGAPVVTPRDLSHRHDRPLLASVAGEQNRAPIRAWLSALGYVETVDYFCVA